MTAVRVRQLGYAYAAESAPVLDDIDLDVVPGELVALVGRSGCGKSSLLYSLNGLIPQALGGQRTGSVDVLGIDPGHTRLADVSRRVGIVFQNPAAQLFRLTVEDDVAFGCENLGMAPAETAARVDEAVERMGLSALRRRPVHQLSGGQQQRLALAGVLAMGCRVLLLDEPSSDLDDEGREALWRVLADLRVTGHSVVIAEHRLNGGRALADRVVALEEGRRVDPPQPAPPPQRRREAFRADGAAVVELADVSCGYPRCAPILAGLSLSVRRGERVAVCGPNGSGKTTLLKLLAGLLPVSAGRAVVCGLEAPRPSCLAGRVGLLCQNPDEQLLADTVEQELAFGPRQMGRRFDPGPLLERLGLAKYRGASPFALSRGERQRLALGGLLAMRPELLLLDEPTSGLDQESWVALLDLVAEQAAADGTAVVFTTHHREAIDAFADRVLTLPRGELGDAR
jgi:energy-coupling factor transporter ATP-binding protein EcfA2